MADRGTRGYSMTRRCTSSSSRPRCVFAYPLTVGPKEEVFRASYRHGARPFHLVQVHAGTGMGFNR